MRKLIAILAVSALFSFAKESEKLPLPQKLQGELPWFALDMKDGENSYNGVLNNNKLKALVKQRGSKRVVLAFFATWCNSCKEGFALMSRQAAELKAKEVLVVLVNVGEEDYGKVSRSVKEYQKTNWLLCFDSFNNIPDAFGLAAQGSEMALPKTLILDQDLRPLTLIGHHGKDFPQILWESL